MLYGKMSRWNFFLYSILITINEIIIVFATLALTMGIYRFLQSPPGRGREGIALAILIIELVLFIPRSIIAIRRNNDAAGPQWRIWLYIIVLVVIAFATAAEFWLHRFSRDADYNIGLEILSFLSLILWGRFLFASPESSGDIDAEIADIAKRYGKAEPESATLVRETQRPVPSINRLPSNTQGGGSFGKRK